MKHKNNHMTFQSYLETNKMLIDMERGSIRCSLCGDSRKRSELYRGYDKYRNCVGLFCHHCWDYITESNHSWLELTRKDNVREEDLYYGIKY